MASNKNKTAAQTAASTAAATRKASAETEKRVAAQTGAKAPSEAEIAKAKAEGAIEDIKDTAKDQHRALTDGNLANDTGARQWHGKDDIMQFEPLLSLGIDEFTARIAEDNTDAPVPEEKVAGLLELERSGQNRTDYVQAMCKRLEVDSPYEVTNAGPGYTNDVTPVTRLAERTSREER